MRRTVLIALDAIIYYLSWAAAWNAQTGHFRVALGWRGTLHLFPWLFLALALLTFLFRLYRNVPQRLPGETLAAVIVVHLLFLAGCTALSLWLHLLPIPGTVLLLGGWACAVWQMIVRWFLWYSAPAQDADPVAGGHLDIPPVSLVDSVTVNLPQLPQPPLVQCLIKRALDLVGAALLLALSVPLGCALFVAISLSSPGPVLVTEPRVGRDGLVFYMVRFRCTIGVARHEAGVVRLADGRLTPIGRWLRRSGLDGMPQLIHVLRGEMSLVGPRPERPEVAFQGERTLRDYAARHTVRPGLTGYTQVMGRSLTDAREQLRSDLWYIRNLSALLDVRIFWRATGKWLRRVALASRPSVIKSSADQRRTRSTQSHGRANRRAKG